MFTKSTTAFAALVAAAAISGPVGATTTLVFQQGLNGYAGTTDTTLSSSDPSGIYGADDAVSIDASDGGSPNHVLLRFADLFGAGPSQIGALDNIVSAKLTVVITSVGSGIMFHDMLRDWNEATATWNSLGNGIQADGVEATAVPFASIGANNGQANIAGPLLEVDVTASLVAAKAGSLPGYGWALLPFMPSGTNGVDFTSSEGFLMADRPLLSVEVAPVPEPETYALMFAGLGLIGWASRRAKVAK